MISRVVASGRLCQSLCLKTISVSEDRSLAGRGEPASLETVTQILSKVTHLPLEQIKPCLHTMENLMDCRKLLSCQKWSQRFSAWVEEHRGLGLPFLSDEAISRRAFMEMIAECRSWWIPISCYIDPSHPMNAITSKL